MKLTVCQGLPGSGKSTWASAQNVVVVNKDDIRVQLKQDQGWEWSREGEKMVVDIRDAKIMLALAGGHDVISSDTNFGKHVGHLKLLAQKAGAEFEIQRFDVPLDECIRRNAQRTGDARVPDSSIYEMYVKFVASDPGHYPLSVPQVQPVSKVEYVERLPSAIICDLDGTLCLNNGHRGVFDYAKADEDELCPQVMRLLEYYKENDFAIIYMSGREEYGREAADKFMLKHGCPAGELFMRGNGDKRKDSIVKRELFDAHVRGKWNIEFVLDDRDQVVKMWRGLGLKCFQVDFGDF